MQEQPSTSYPGAGSVGDLDDSDDDGDDGALVADGQDQLAVQQEPAAVSQRDQRSSVRLSDSRDAAEAAQTRLLDVVQRELLLVEVGLVATESPVQYSSQVRYIIRI